MSFSEKYPVSDNMGELKVREDGLFLSFSYTCAKVAEPSRLVICCGENTLSLGIPVPESGVLRLSKRVSLSALRRSGIGRIEKARLVPLSQKPEVSEKHCFASSSDGFRTELSESDDEITFLSSLSSSSSRFLQTPPCPSALRAHGMFRGFLSF